MQKTGIIAKDVVMGVFPSWYKLTYHTKEYVLDKFGKYLTVLKYIEKRIFNI